jgi:putative membrane protein
MTDIRKPAVFRIAPDGGRRTKTRRTIPASQISFAPDTSKGELVVVPPAPLPAPKRMRWSLILIAALAGLAAIWAGLSIVQLIEDLFARSQTFGWIGVALAGIAGLAAFALVVREIWGLMRLNRIEHIQADAAHALNHDDAAAAERTVTALKNLYADRHDAAWGLAELAEHASAVMDPADRIRLTDRDLVSGFDEEAHRIVARAARRVTMLTAVTPAAALDILFVAAQNLRMLREIATLYGGRPSFLSTLKLARMVVSHLAVAGGLAMSDSLIQHVIGKGLIGRLSARLGEGAVNGILTARIGLAARDVCRPIPQPPEARETLSALIREIVSLGDKSAGAVGDPEKPALPNTQASPLGH